MTTAPNPLRNNVARLSPRMLVGLTPAQREFALDVFEGLSAHPKRLYPKWFYDAAGSALFEQITELDEYYLTRTEQEIFDTHADEIARMLRPPIQLLELGAGTSRKTRTLLRAVLKRQPACVFAPIDVSPEALAEGKRTLEREFDNVRVTPVLTDYTRDLAAVREISSRKLLLYIGSSIGNFDADEAAALLERIHGVLAPGDTFLLGTDLRPDPMQANKTVAQLVAAYDDAEEVTAAFNKNVLARINRELDADFDLDRFRHVALWNENESRIEMHLESTSAQRVRIQALAWTAEFAAGERIHTESSHKYSPGAVVRMLEKAGFTTIRTWRDPHHRFAVTLAAKS